MYIYCCHNLIHSPFQKLYQPHQTLSDSIMSREKVMNFTVILYGDCVLKTIHAALIFANIYNNRFRNSRGRNVWQLLHVPLVTGPEMLVENLRLSHCDR